MKEALNIKLLVIIMVTILLMGFVTNVYADTNTIYMYVVNSSKYGKVEIPIPAGFRYKLKDGVLYINDSQNEDLLYIWVPMSKDLKIKEELWKNVYQKYQTEKNLEFSKESNIYKIFWESEENLDSEFKESIKQYGGFYISEAELSYDKSGKEQNKARGMINSTTTEISQGGDYYRGNNNDLNKLKSIAESLYKNNYAVRSHIMYGIEWDATLLWIANTNPDYVDSKGNSIETILIGNSTYVGKYSNSGISMNSEASAVKYLNGIWGLGGNLSELTQEKYKEKNIVRGGSYKDTGENSPIASREAVSDINSEDVGIRTTLYIKPGLNRIKLNNNEIKSDNEIEKLEQHDYISISDEKVAVKKHKGENGIVRYERYYDTYYTWYAQNAGQWIENKYWDDEIWNNGCGPTSIATVASGWGYNWNPGDVVNFMHEKERRYTSCYNLEATLQDMGISTWSQESNTVESIRNWIRKGNRRPVIVCVHSGGDNYFTNGGHIMPIIAVSKNGEDFYVANPNVDSPSYWVSANTVLAYTSYAIYCQP